MTNGPQSQTGSLTRAFFQNPTEEGWEAFVDHYGPRVFGWCRSKGLQASDANDVLQNVLVRLHSAMTRAPWDPERGLLRSWLKRITMNALIDFVRQRQVATHSPEWLQTIVDSQEQLADELADEEVRRVAQAETELRVGPKKWQVFFLRVFDGQSGQQVAETTGLSVGTVYNYYSEVSRVFAHELERLVGSS